MPSSRGPPGSQASSRGEAKDSALLSSRDGYPLEPKSGLNGVNPPVEFGKASHLAGIFCPEGFAGGSDGKESACNAGSLGSIPE